MMPNLPQGTRVVIHSTTSSILDGKTATVCGIAVEGPVRIYILRVEAWSETTNRMIDGVQYECVALPESCIRTV